VAGKDPSVPQVPIIDHPDVRRMLLAQKSYVEGAVALVLYAARLLDDQRTAPTQAEADRARLLLDTLTPVVKSWPSQWCLEANSLAIQVHGGYGYTREYEVEQHYRDNRLNPIHEGTHGIQALDLLGRKVIAADGAGLAVLAETIGATVARATATGGELADLAVSLGAAVDRVVAVTAALWATVDGETGPDIEGTLANATVYLEAVGHVVVAWLWLEQALAAAGKSGEFYDGKRQAACYFYRWELPKTGPQFDLLASRDRTAVDMNPDWF
jgi:butyryl-CoA dehydrogenase